MTNQTIPAQRRRAPTAARATAAALPPAPYRVFRSLLPNGLRLVTIETPHLHTASIALYARVGARYETRKTNGLSHFVEHMLFRGSQGFGSSYALSEVDAANSDGDGDAADATVEEQQPQRPEPEEPPDNVHVLGPDESDEVAAERAANGTARVPER